MRHLLNKKSASALLSLFSGMILSFGSLQAQTPTQIPGSQSFGQLALGATPVTANLSLTFTGYANPSFALAYNLDFSLQSTPCTGNAGTITCTATVAFQPTLPGLRKNALLVKNVNGQLIATVLLSGTGLAPQAVVYPGVISTVAGRPGVMGVGSYTNGDNGYAAQAKLFNPLGLAIDNAGNLYIADSLDQVIRKVNASTGVISTVAGRMAIMGATGDGAAATSATLNNPVAVTLDGAGNLYIADMGNNRIRKVTAATGLISTVAGTATPGASSNGIGDGGAATSALLNGPADVAVDGAGNLYIADSYNGLIRKVTASTGIITSLIGGLNNPRSLDVDAAGNLYVAVGGGVEEISTSGSLTLLCQPVNPMGVRVDAAGNVYIADQGKNEVLQYNPAIQSLSILAGNAAAGYTGDGMLATATALNAPQGLALDASGNLYVADSVNSIVRRVSAVAALNFANTPVNEISAAQTVTLANIGNQSLTMSNLSVGAPFQQQSIAGAACSASSTLASGARCLLTLVFAPVSSVTSTTTAVLTDNSLNVTTNQTIALSGTGISAAAPQVALNPTSLTFGSQAIGVASAVQSVTISNTGAAPLAISSIRVEGNNAADFVLSNVNCASALAAGSSCNVSVAFKPTASGNRSAALILVDNLAAAQQVALSGTGGSPTLVFASSAVTFPNRVLNNAATSVSVSISNGGSAPLNLSAVALTGANPADFSIASNGCTAGVSAGSSCTLTVSFSPKALGLRTAALSVLSNASSAAQSVRLAGKATLQTAVSVFRPSNGTWYVNRNNAITVKQWGLNGDIPVVGDFDGDGQLDFTVWRPANGTWYTVLSSTGAMSIHQWGLPGDIPVAADFDGDGKADLAVWRPSNGVWFIIPSSTGVAYTQQWGLNGDVPMAGDFDGDGKADMAVWRPANGIWFIIPSSTGKAYMSQWGLPGDIPVLGDFDGDGKADIAIWRPSSGTWWVVMSSTNTIVTRQWGLPDDIPVAADFDGDGKTDFAVWRPALGMWYVFQSSNGSIIQQQWGLPGDTPMKGLVN